LRRLHRDLHSFPTRRSSDLPKAILNVANDVVYFSRQTIPFFRGIPSDQWLNQHKYYKHIGIYAYRTDVLAEITRLDVSPLEKARSEEHTSELQSRENLVCRL